VLVVSVGFVVPVGSSLRDKTDVLMMTNDNGGVCELAVGDYVLFGGAALLILPLLVPVSYAQPRCLQGVTKRGDTAPCKHC
jgi:hypothetical protein